MLTINGVIYRIICYNFLNNKKLTFTNITNSYALYVVFVQSLNLWVHGSIPCPFNEVNPLYMRNYTRDFFIPLHKKWAVEPKLGPNGF